MNEEKIIKSLKKLYNKLSGGKTLPDQDAKLILQLAREAYEEAVPKLFR
jgi:hypothetical protein